MIFHSLFISPHSDDQVLFGSYTLIRENPLVLVITDSFIQENRGDRITAEQRRLEDLKAMQILHCPLMFAHLRDDQLDAWQLRRLFADFHYFDKVYIPALQGGNAQHDLIHNVAEEFFPNAISYATYAKNQPYTPLEGGRELEPLPYEWELKNQALDCYKSQIDLLATLPHFQAVRANRKEYLDA